MAQNELLHDSRSAASDLFAGPGEMRALCRDFDWASTPVGTVQDWSPALRAAVRLVLDSGFPMCLHIGPEFNLLYNDALIAAVGSSRHPVVLGLPTQVAWGEIWHDVGPQMKRVVETASPVDHVDRQFLLDRNGGTELTFWTYSLSPVRDELGNVIAVLNLAAETTSRVPAQAALRENEARYRALATASNDVLYRMSPDWSEMRQLDGRGFLSDTPEPSATWLQKYIHPDDQPAVLAAIGNAIRNRTTFALEHRVLRADGTLGWTSSRAIPILDNDGDIVEWIGAAADVTARKENEAALRQSEEKYRTLFEKMDQGYCEVELIRDNDGRPFDMLILELNTAFERIFGMSRDSARGRNVTEVFPALDPWWIDSFDRIAASGTPETIEHEFTAQDRWYEVHVYPASRDRLTVLYDDVTTRHRAADALRSSEERKAFLLTLADGLRELADARDIRQEATRLLRAQLGCELVMYGETSSDDDDIVTVTAVDQDSDFTHVLGGSFRFSDFNTGQLDRLRRGEELVFDDVELADITGQQRSAYAEKRVRSYITSPLVKEGRPVAILTACRSEPHVWTQFERDIIRETAERTWATIERARAEGALRESQAQLAAVFEALPVGIGLMDLEGRLVLSNSDMEHRYMPGRRMPSRDAARGHRWRAWDRNGRIVDTSEYPGARALRGEHVLPGLEMLYLQDDGREIWTRVATVPVRDANGRVTGAAVAITDIDELKRSADALRASEQRYRALVENVRDHAIFMLNANGEISEWTEGAERATGYSSQEAVGKPVSFLDSPGEDASGMPDNHLADLAATGRGEWEGWRLRKDGSRYWANEIATAVRDSDERLIGYTVISRDLTEHRAAQEAAERVQRDSAREELRRALAAAEEAERRRLSRELHDQLGQELTAFRFGLDDALHEHERCTTEDAEHVLDAQRKLRIRLVQLRELAFRMTTGARAIAIELRPPELDDVGLESALESYVAEWSDRYGILADFAATGAGSSRLPADVGSALYRIAQEALTNVAKHAGATQVSVLLGQSNSSEVRLIVEDNGRGFDVDHTVTVARQDHRLGLAGMQERAALVGGSVNVESTAGAGTSVYVRLSVARGVEAAHDDETGLEVRE